MKLLVTGSMGFIATNFIDKYEEKYEIKELDLYEISIHGYSGILDGIDFVVNFGAQTFVDHSIKDPKEFVDRNILGTFELLEQTRKYPIKKFIHISTDEVYGSVLDGYADEKSMLNPGNPYSATKASCDMMCLAYHNTYGTPIIILRPENNYGKCQDRRKLIPKTIECAIKGINIPVYGDGKHHRMWLHVDDFCEAVDLSIEHGSIGSIYNVGGKDERENIYIVNKILEIMRKPKYLIEYIPDTKARPGHDRRYAINTDKIELLGFKPKHNIDKSLGDVVEWYLKNQWMFK